MEKIKVCNLYNKNQFVLESGTKTAFQSYESTCAIYDSSTCVLVFGKDWNYSNTTRKHLYIFLNDYVPLHLFKGLNEALESTNKKEALQELINKGIIKYNASL